MPIQRTPESMPRRTGNRLLDRLPEDEYVRLAPSLVSTTLKLKHILNQAGNPIHDVHFPTSAVVSTLVLMEDGSEVETILIGAEGMVGLTVALGIDFALHNAICQVPGDAFRLPATSFQEALQRSPTLDALIRRYTAVVLRQVTQVVACNARHPVNERLCRWLLMSHDRADRDEFPMTQEFMAEMLGVRRQTVTITAGTLQEAGLITFRRGIIRIDDRPRLEEAACECYAVIRTLSERILP